MSQSRKEASGSVNPVTLWRSLDELRGDAKRRITINGITPGDRVSREHFLKLMGASLALAGLTACAGEPKGPTKIVPQVQRPEGVSPAESLYFASALTHQGYANGVLVRSVSGRPIKVEGNVGHPASLGATNIFAQAEILTFYDPDRSPNVLQKGQTSSWEDFTAALTPAVAAQSAKQGGGLRILTETVTSPSLTAQLNALLKQFPSAKWHVWEPINRDNVREGARQAFGAVVDPRYHLDQAEAILTLDADLLTSLPGSLRYAREFSEKRRVTIKAANQNRLYAIESAPTVTGMAADHRLPARSSDIGTIAQVIAAGVGVSGGAGAQLPEGVSSTWVAAIVKDLTSHRGSSLIVAGDEQPPAVHVLAHQMNQALGNVGKTVVYTDPIESNPIDRQQSFRDLVADMNDGKVDLLLTLGANPAYTAPADVDFGTALSKVALSVHLGLHADETAEKSTWHVPLAHELESWGDARAFDGTTTIIQPLINPLYGGKTPLELLAAVGGKPTATAHDLVKDYWQQQSKASDFAIWWRTTLNDGVVPDTAVAPQTVTLKATTIGSPSPAAANGLELIFRADPTVYDGRFANNGWLQELPKPLTTLTWDNTVQVGPGLAKRLSLTNGDLVELDYAGKKQNAPIWVLAGHPDNAATIHLGYGRTAAGKLGNGLGFNAYGLRASETPWFGGGLQITKLGQRYPLAATQGTQNMEGRDIVRNGTLAEYQHDPEFIKKEIPALVGSMYTPFTYNGNRWGMSINLGSCIGCNACAIACQAENNVPIVGKDQVTRGRHMHWIRIDRYYEGPAENPISYSMPVPCMQCENAPCEVVCPVGATTHSDEGLNDMVYNRCVGTRYCSNNCPYKVRRFNFYQYSDYTTPIYQLMYNPDVTVRERGVMEKCTYCIQRIRHGQTRASNAGRSVRDGEIVTACQAVCPTQAIVFGDLNDKESKVAALKADVLNYDLLGELNTRPRTSYLAAIRNPNPDIKVE